MARLEKESEGSSSRKLKSICVFGENVMGKDNDCLSAAYDLGNILATRKINLVYGGGMKGLRGTVAVSSLVRSNKVLGVVVSELIEKDKDYFPVGTELKVLTLSGRMNVMFQNAEAFIALPGGLETLDEISSLMHWAKLSLHKKPLGLLNTNGFYDGLLSFLDHAVEKELISPEIRRMIISASTPDQLVDQLQDYALALESSLKQATQQSSASKGHELDTTLQL